MTSYKEELEEQQRWKLKPEYIGATIFDNMLAEEFMSPDDISDGQNYALEKVISYATKYVPYYTNLFEKLKLSANAITSIDDLQLLPVLTKEEVLEKEQLLHTTSLPAGESIFGYFSTSGTTGRRVRVLMTKNSNLMFSFLTIRQHRWCRFDPLKTLAYIRARVTILGHGIKKSPKDTTTFSQKYWNYAGQFFKTGNSIAMSHTTTLEDQVQWMQENNPAYLISYPSMLEEYAFARNDGPPVDSIEAVMGISAQMTTGMRTKIEKSYGIPVHQCYGLNEIGLVATRCEAGRYHVHAQHCIVEIVDEDGLHCQPGETGRIVITGLNNLAMPLIRYDTDDTAVATDDSCPCGRTLPSFGEVTGRYRRWRGLPEGSREKHAVIRKAFESLPNNILINIRRFQVHQYETNVFELRIVSKVSLNKDLVSWIMKQWHSEYGDSDNSLYITQVDEILPGRGGKLNEFTSDFFS